MGMEKPMAWNEPGNKGNDNDPWGSGGRKGGDQGPPDIDEVIKSVTRKLNSLFGGGKSGSGNSGSSGSGGSGSVSAGMLAGVVVVAVVIWAAMGFYTVDESERGVVMRFGSLLDEVGTPGIHWNPPPGGTVAKVHVSPVHTRSFANDLHANQRT